MKIKIKDGDLYHVGIVVETSECLLFKEFPLCGFEQRTIHETTFEVGRLGVLTQNMVEGGDKEPCRAARRISNALAGLWIHQRGDEVNDVSWGAKLAVCARGRELAEEILLHISFEVVAIMGGKIEFVNTLNNGAERRTVINLERGTTE